MNSELDSAIWWGNLIESLNHWLLPNFNSWFDLLLQHYDFPVSRYTPSELRLMRVAVEMVIPRHAAIRVGRWMTKTICFGHSYLTPACCVITLVENIRNHPPHASANGLQPRSQHDDGHHGNFAPRLTNKDHADSSVPSKQLKADRLLCYGCNERLLPVAGSLVDNKPHFVNKRSDSSVRSTLSLNISNLNLQCSRWAWSSQIGWLDFSKAAQWQTDFGADWFTPTSDSTALRLAPH